MSPPVKRLCFVGTVLCCLALVTDGAFGQSAVRGWRDRLVVSAPLPGTTAAERAVYLRLDTTVVSFTFNDQPLEEALDFLSTLGGVNIVLDRRKVEEGKTVTLKLTNVTLATAVKLITEQLELKWIVRDGVVYISDEEGTRREPVTIVYDVADLLAMPPNFQGPNIELQSITGGRGGSGTGTNTGSISPWGETEDNPEADEHKTREELLQELVDLIRSVIEPGSWDETGR
ncbi:MAG TPA: STN domain-containing protein [Planctomycetota bacterium]|nr:STN domain-containing protein [Planctomycetota bacterium]